MLRKRKKFIMNDRVSKNIGGVCMRSYAFVNASMNLHFGDAHKHNNIMRGVCVGGVGVVGVPGRPLLFSLFCNKGNTKRRSRRSLLGHVGATVPPMARRAPTFHGVRVSGVIYENSKHTVFFGNLPRVPVDGIAIGGIIVARTASKIIVDRMSKIALRGICMRSTGNGGVLGIGGTGGLAISKGICRRLNTGKRVLDLGWSAFRGGEEGPRCRCVRWGTRVTSCFVLGE